MTWTSFAEIPTGREARKSWPDHSKLTEGYLSPFAGLIGQAMTLTDDYDLSGLTKGKINLKVLFKDGNAARRSLAIGLVGIPPCANRLRPGGAYRIAAAL